MSQSDTVVECPCETVRLLRPENVDVFTRLLADAAYAGKWVVLVNGVCLKADTNKETVLDSIDEPCDLQLVQKYAPVYEM
jgi:hypothetical protein